MARRLGALFARVGDRLGSLSVGALALVGGLILILTVAGGSYAYRTYDYVQHDNEFCFSCHLMQEPYELFAQSAHRGLGCKACHQPNLIERSQMGVTGVVMDPDSISVHADVPNDLCADCHINGDPDRWTLVANSAGHRVHLESEDPALQGLQCVECHSSSLHEFAAVDRTCAQSGCHTDSKVQLGAMSDLTIHCAACHGFSTPLPEGAAELEGALTPDESTCLSCHEMRILVEMPDPDPHASSCASCHNPHEQTTPAEAVESCSSSACHTDPVSISAFHEGLDEGVAADCLYCHEAHDFSVDGDNCVACHQGIMTDDPLPVRRSAEGASPHGAVAPGALAVSQGGPGVTSPALALFSADDVMHSWGYPIPQTLDFRHSDHPGVDCASCHESSEEHGAVTVTTVTDCRSCHHQGEALAAGGCASCHEASDTPADPYPIEQRMTFSTGSAVDRALPFDHADHSGEDCASCHTDGGLDLTAESVDCASCHETHHEVTNDCMSCHIDTGPELHPVAQAHVTCSGAGCHQETPFDGVPRERTVCLVCHQDRVDHRPEGDCAECHALGPGGFDG